MDMSDDLLPDLLRDPVFAAAWHAGVRARVGVSACLTGEPVRHDGGHRRVPAVADRLATLVELVPLCPEVAIGLGVPRPAIQRVRLDDGSEVVRGVVQRDLDVTAALDAYAARIVRETALHGYVFKARSPSCAPGSAPLYDVHDRQIGTGRGRHAQRLYEAWPSLPVCDEEALAGHGALQAFVLACYRMAARPSHGRPPGGPV